MARVVLHPEIAYIKVGDEITNTWTPPDGYLFKSLWAEVSDKMKLAHIKQESLKHVIRINDNRHEEPGQPETESEE